MALKSSNNVETNVYALEIEISAADFDAAQNKVFAKQKNRIQLPGFRKGKAPVGMLKSRYADDIKQELERRLVSAAYQKIANTDEDVLSCGIEGSPKVEFDKEFKFTFNVDLAPEIELGEYKGLEVAVETKEVSDADVAERLNMYRTMYANYADVTDEAKAEDMLKVSYTSDFAVSENASAYLKRQVEAEDNFLWLKEPEMIPGSVAALTGAKVGDVKEFELEFTLDCTLSNCVQVALGIDVNRDGELSFAETGAVLGWRNGRYFIEDVENGKRYEYPVESESRIGIEVFTVNLRTKRGGVDASAWLYNPNWNLMKITRRGRDMPSEWIRCKLDYSGFYITIR